MQNADERARQAVRDGDVAGLVDALNLDETVTPRDEIRQKADDWAYVHAWLVVHPELTVSLAADTVLVHGLNEAEATELLLCGAPAGSVTRREQERYVAISRQFGSVDVRAMVRVPKPEPVVLNPETAA